MMVKASRRHDLRRSGWAMGAPQRRVYAGDLRSLVSLLYLSNIASESTKRFDPHNASWPFLAPDRTLAGAAQDRFTRRPCISNMGPRGEGVGSPPEHCVPRTLSSTPFRMKSNSSCLALFPAGDWRFYAVPPAVPNLTPRFKPWLLRET